MRPELITVGESFEDLIFSDLPRVPRPGEELKTDRFVRTFGGGAVITAVAAARLGLRCEVVSALGEDAEALLLRESVAVTNLRRPGEAPAVSVALSTRRERSFVTFNGVNDALSDRLLALAPRLRAGHVHFAFQPRRCGRWLDVLRELRRADVATSWDFGWNPALRDDARFADLAAALDYVFANEAEARLYSRCLSFRAAVGHWKAHARNMLIKRGMRGARWVGRGVDLEAGAPEVAVADTTGAGDAFDAGFLYGILKGRPPEECLRLANAVGALSTRKAGGLDALPRRRELG